MDDGVKLPAAIAGAKALVDRIITSGKNNIRISVTSFGRQGNDGTGKLPANNNSILHIGLSNNYTAVKNAVSSIHYINFGTCILCGIRIGNNSLINPVNPNLKYEILLSDGIENSLWNGSGTGDGPAGKEADTGRANGITYYVIGYGKRGDISDIDEPNLIHIAGNSNNYKYRPNAADWANTFVEILGNICGNHI